MAHTPVLLQEVIRFLNLRAGDFAIDGTIDGGGHAREVLKMISPGGTLLGVDLDAAMIARLQGELSESRSRVELVAGNYADIPLILEKLDLPAASGLILDLGFSSDQLESSGRGFSFSKDEPLRMTYAEGAMTAAQAIRKLSERELKLVISRFGEERYAGRIAKAIKERERRDPIRTTAELRTAIENAVPRGYERGRIHPATRTFQALRIYVNDELENLKKILKSVSRIVRPKGRVVVISFHSLEDRTVKQAFRDMERETVGVVLTKQPVKPTEEEILKNPRSRSAKLRALELQ
ncbi:16S rRNA (cytosine(1402)-N(4))-methyltransferase RsmH [Candidatus Parcubacteria bacterium]|nr:MAG: 16S rRNA (cytosine(1402)-N(4))-methyltransferase RsmH [Candidatus Parcubacteria bacterium]